MRYHKCPACRKVGKVENGLATTVCPFCSHRSTVPVNTDTPLPFSLQQLQQEAGVDAGSASPAVIRYSSTVSAHCFPLGAASWDGYWARITGLTATGVGLLLYRRVEPKTLLRMNIEDQREVLGAFMARVDRVHCIGAGQWLVACKFAQRIDEDLHDEITARMSTGMVPVDTEAGEPRPSAGQTHDEANKPQPAGNSRFLRVFAFGSNVVASKGPRNRKPIVKGAD